MKEEITYRKLLLTQMERVLRTLAEEKDSMIFEFKVFYSILPKEVREQKDMKDAYKEMEEANPAELEGYNKMRKAILEGVSAVVDNFRMREWM